MVHETLAELRGIAAAGPPYPPAFLRRLRGDPRAGAQAVYATCVRREKRAREQQAHIDQMWRFERRVIANGFTRVAGVDEAGRGPLAGPLVAAAIVLGERVPGLDDSKRLTQAQRQRLFDKLRRGPHAIGVALIEPEFVDRRGIQEANYAAFAQAVAQLEPPPDFLLVDGFAIPGCSIPHMRLIKGDRRSASVAAASIIAKVTRDRLMLELSDKYPMYAFAKNKGYGTKEHLAALARFGPCPVHRRSFAPIAASLDTEDLFPASLEEDSDSCA
ncbi:MAG TPA: ribonuclease HII [Candidatus Hydrogenedentes bacterium]|nr:ribonuclease HII [Candidatus Hydrogenedentota bacterium]HIJ73219.1 ribonuclease HII [Candidatus Hydrogenedentota bacterium]